MLVPPSPKKAWALARACAPLLCKYVRVAAHGSDSAIFYRDGLRDGKAFVNGDNLPAMKDQVRVRRNNKRRHTQDHSSQQMISPIHMQFLY